MCTNILLLIVNKINYIVFKTKAACVIDIPRKGSARLYSLQWTHYRPEIPFCTQTMKVYRFRLNIVSCHSDFNTPACSNNVIITIGVGTAPTAPAMAGPRFTDLKFGSGHLPRCAGN